MMIEDSNYRTRLIDLMKIDIDKRYFLVGFKNRDVLAVYPNKDNPLRFALVSSCSDSSFNQVRSLKCECAPDQNPFAPAGSLRARYTLLGG